MTQGEGREMDSASTELKALVHQRTLSRQQEDKSGTVFAKDVSTRACDELPQFNNSKHVPVRK